MLDVGETFDILGEAVGDTREIIERVARFKRATASFDARELSGGTGGNIDDHIGGG